MKSFPARLHVLLAREASKGLVIRRGPSKLVCTLLWDRERDTFEIGQWLRGRIYERRSDLSPDGRHFIYFAMNGRWQSETKGSWTAISRTPDLHAVTLFGHGDCWNGGGLFLSNEKYWLNAPVHGLIREDAQLQRDPEYHPPADYGCECRHVYFNRLQRDGWVLRNEDYHAATVFEKPLGDSWVLRKLANTGSQPGRGCYWDMHELKHQTSGVLLAFPEWEWADLDRNRLVWAANGQLRSGQLKDGALTGECLLHDFNAMKFQAIPAPY